MRGQSSNAGSARAPGKSSSRKSDSARAKGADIEEAITGTSERARKGKGQRRS